MLGAWEHQDGYLHVRATELYWVWHKVKHKLKG